MVYGKDLIATRDGDLIFDFVRISSNLRDLLTSLISYTYIGRDDQHFGLARLQNLLLIFIDITRSFIGVMDTYEGTTASSES